MNRKLPNPVAVIDIGTARTKVTCGFPSNDGEVEYKSFTIDSNIVEAWKVGGVEKAKVCLREIVRESSAIINKLGIVSHCYVGAHLFRDEVFSDELAQFAKTLLGKFTILNPSLEASLYYCSLKKEMGSSNFFAVDIGGGSVQLVWGENIGECCSYPLGTYSLESNYQKNLEVSLSPMDVEWRDAVYDITEKFANRVPSALTASRLIVGSNFMQDFFSSAFRKACGYPCTIGKDQVYSVCKKIGGKKYEDIYCYFPSFKKFMHGADKLLIVVYALMKLLKCNECVGTNMSVSKGILNLMANEPNKLEELGLDFHRSKVSVR